MAYSSLNTIRLVDIKLQKFRIKFLKNHLLYDLLDYILLPKKAKSISEINNFLSFLIIFLIKISNKPLGNIKIISLL